MRHAKAFRKLGRTSSHRKALFRNMLTSLIRHERIETTVPKAKELKRLADRYVTVAKKNTLASRRKALGFVLDKSCVHKLFAEIGPRYASRNGGYTRVLRTRVRPGDASEMAIIEFVDRPEPEQEPEQTAAIEQSEASEN